MRLKRIEKKQLLSILALILITLGLALATSHYSSKVKPEAAEPFCKYLISYGIAENGAYPDYLASHLQEIEAIPNFQLDGVGIETYPSNSKNPMHQTMNGTVSISKDDLRTQFQSLMGLGNQGIHPQKLKHNFIMVHLQQYAGGFYGPDASASEKATADLRWQTVANNFANLAAVAKEIDDSGFGIDGIFLDNEGPYSEPGGFWCCNSGCGQNYAPACNDNPSSSGYNLPFFQAQARTRGQQIINAISPQFANMQFMYMHGIDTSCTGLGEDYSGYDGLGITKNDTAWANELASSFLLGLADSASNGVVINDGGEESYRYTTTAKFNLSYNFRKAISDPKMTTYIDPNHGTISCPWIPDSLKSGWSSLFKAGFGLYNGEQTEASIGEATRLALTKSDRYVWFYMDHAGTGLDWTTINYPGSTQFSASWTAAMKSARDAVVNDPTCESDSPPQSPTPPPEKPDLVITNVSISPPNPAINDNVTFSVTIKNQGTAATSTGVDAFLGFGIKIDDQWITWNDKNTAILPAGQTVILTPDRQDNGSKTWTAVGGTHTLSVVVDNAGKIDESDESNNTVNQTLNVSTPLILNLNIQLQGRTNFSTSDTELKIYDANSGLVFTKADVATNQLGNSQISLPNTMTPGSPYSFYLKPKYYLADYKANQILTSPFNLSFAIFKSGDLDNNNFVNSLDFAVLNGKWLSQDLIADINKDGLVNSLDYALLNSNFGQGQ